MKLNRVARILLWLVTLSFCSCYRNPPERNKIVFEDDVKEVQKALVKMNGLLSQLPDNHDLNVNYSCRNGQLEINGRSGFHPIGNVANLNPDTVWQLKKMNLLDRRLFIKLAAYLEKNHLTDGYSERSANAWAYGYRVPEDEEPNETRLIVLKSKMELPNLEETFKILDNKEDIYLIAGRDAIIR